MELLKPIPEMLVTSRQATDNDRDFLWNLKKASMRKAIDAIYGWDETIQLQLFRESFTPQSVTIITVDNHDAGMYELRREPDHWMLCRIEMLPEFQSRGVGSNVIRGIISDAIEAGKDIRLQVFKANPAHALYRRLGFVPAGESDTHIQMELRYSGDTEPPNLTPHTIIIPAVTEICGSPPQQLMVNNTGGLNETWQARLGNGRRIIIRISHRPEPWFMDEPAFSSLATEAGIPAPDIIGVRHIRHTDNPLSVSVQQYVPGQSLAELADKLNHTTLVSLTERCGELLAHLHNIDTQTQPSLLNPPQPEVVERICRQVGRSFDSSAAAIVERGALAIADRPGTLPAPDSSISHGDWLPKHLLFNEQHCVVGVIDWEFSTIASPARDLAHWEVASGSGFQHTTDALHTGYKQVRRLKNSDTDWIPVYAIDYSLDVLSWKKPASIERQHQCIEVIKKHLQEFL